MQAASGPLISLSPSFNTYSSSDRLAQIAARVVSELTSQDHQLTHDEPDWESLYATHHLEEEQEQVTQQQQQQQQQHRQPQNDGVHEEAEQEEEEFEFAFVGGDAHTSPISADEIFSNGQIRPVYPLFDQGLLKEHNDVVCPKKVNGDADAVNKKNSEVATTPKQRRLPLRMLMIEEERETASCSSSEADDLENLPPGTYCVWTPPKTKSSSAGSSKRWKFRDLLYRSSSEGKETFVFLAPSSTKRADNKNNNNKDDVVSKKRVGGGGGGGVSQNEERFVVRSKAAEEGDKRRSFLPYRQDFVGFFSNVNGLSRNLHPF
ncbi:Hypothetical predicted protein [Prunus dulcis]|uniref:Uncharacterized protein n=1 Tax=Prunus dulcis TaxID=3755 RepID=A0A5E4EMJ0_PRUDU|nr:homeotic protein female sterile [Prunus dulcis]VVA16904.1 Hypothetical predicted protein [Prunus dulcis]